MWLARKINDLLFAFDRWRYGEGRYYKNSNLWSDKDRTDHLLDDLTSGLSLEILRGPFKGTVFSYISLQLDDQHNEGKFDIHIISGKIAKVKKDKFARIARKIMLNILYKLIHGEGNLQLGLKPGEEFVDEDRTRYIEEPSAQRVICSKGLTISEK